LRRSRAPSHPPEPSSRLPRGAPRKGTGSLGQHQAQRRAPSSPPPPSFVRARNFLLHRPRAPEAMGFRPAAVPWPPPPSARIARRPELRLGEPPGKGGIRTPAAFARELSTPTGVNRQTPGDGSYCHLNRSSGAYARAQPASPRQSRPGGDMWQQDLKQLRVGTGRARLALPTAALPPPGSCPHPPSPGSGSPSRPAARSGPPVQPTGPRRGLSRGRERGQ